MAIFVEKESDQIRERETRSERQRKSSRGQAARPRSRDLGRATRVMRPGSRGPGYAAWVARPSSHEPQVSHSLGRATWAARLARPEVHRGLGGSNFFFVFVFFFFPSSSDFIFVGAVVLLYIGL